jgi:hypothetical protein
VEAGDNLAGSGVQSTTGDGKGHDWLDRYRENNTPFHVSTFCRRDDLSICRIMQLPLFIRTHKCTFVDEWSDIVIVLVRRSLDGFWKWSARGE